MLINNKYFIDLRTLILIFMKKTSSKFFLSFVCLFFNFIAFAQIPATEDSEGCLQCDDAPAAPINTKLLWLAIIGIIYAYSIFRKSQKIKAAN